MGIDLENKAGTRPSRYSFSLILASFVAGLCSLVYELLISTTSSYFLGDSVKQFSLVIGTYLAAMGIGSYLTKYIEDPVLEKFVAFEILLGFIGGLSIPVLYLAFAYTPYYNIIMFSLVIGIGVITGLEIPMLTRLLQKYYALKLNLSLVLSSDYLGALLGTLCFPFLFLPFVGLFKSSLLVGFFNMFIGFMVLVIFSDKISAQKRRLYWLLSILMSLLFCFLFFTAQQFLNHWSSNLFKDRIIHSEQSAYQQIVLTRNKEDFRLFINGGLQFSSLDEYRYHESLVHIPVSLLKNKKSILILGGGDGLAARELLKYPAVQTITIVDLDPAIVNLSKSHYALKTLNKGSLEHPKVTIYNQDAFKFLLKTSKQYDLIISDLPDPTSPSLARLYSKEFYQLVSTRLKKEGIFVTQATSPLFAKSAFWCINRTLSKSGFDHVKSYHVYIPSFGDWGFVMASEKEYFSDNVKVEVPTKFLSTDIVSRLFIFSQDLQSNETEISTIDAPQILKYYEQGWNKWN